MHQKDFSLSSRSLDILQKSTEKKSPFSLIDLGSNSVRLSIYDSIQRVPELLYEEGFLTELGRDLTTHQKISQDGLKIVEDAFQRFQKITADFKTIPIVLATETFRQAKDGPQILQNLENQYGFSIQALSGQEEMFLAYQAILFCKETASGLVADYGGGSLEIALLENGSLKDGTSLPIGALRLIQDQDGTPFSYQDAKKKIKEVIHTHPWIGNLKKDSITLFLLGGAWRLLAQFYMQTEKYPFPLIHGYTPNSKNFTSFVEEISFYTEKDIARFSTKRKKTLPRASLALYELLTILKPQSLFYCGYGIREGFLYTNLSSQEKQKYSFLYFAQKKRTLRNFVPILLEKTYPLFPFIEKVFLEALLYIATPFYPRQYPFQGEQAFFEMLTWNIPSLTHEERIFCALVRYIAREGHGPDPQKSSFHSIKILDKRMFKRATALGQLLYILYDICGQSSNLLKEIELFSQNKLLILKAPYHFNIKETSLPLFEQAAQNMGLSSCVLRTSG